MVPQDRDNLSNFQRLQHLESGLSIVEQWLEIFFDNPLENWIAVNVDAFTQFLHSLVVVFKLLTYDEPGWDTEEVKSRVNLLSIMDKTIQITEEVPVALGLNESAGAQIGFFAKTKALLLAVKALFARELEANLPQSLATEETGVSGFCETDLEMMGQNFQIPVNFLENLYSEPWVLDIFGGTWDNDFVDMPATFI